MKLVLIQDTQGNELPLCDVPRNVLNSMQGMRAFFQINAIRTFGGDEGKDWRIVANDHRCLVPLRVEQLLVIDGKAEYGQTLVIK